MKTIRLGPDGPPVSQFGVGAMSFAGIYGDASVEDSHAVLDAAFEAGVTHIDTANVYGAGRSEEIIGTWFAAHPGARDRMKVATKAGKIRDADRPHNCDPGHLAAELDKSLRRLGTSHVDLFYVHRLDPAHSVEDTAGTLKRLIDTGKTRAIGFSEIAPTSLRRAATECPVAAVQSEYSLATRYPELGLVQTCAELGTTLVAYSPVGRSFLTGRPFSLERARGMAFTRDNPRFMEPNYSANFAATDAFRALAAELEEPAAALAIAWLISRGDHILPIPGTASTAHFAELLRGTEITLSQDMLDRIDTVLPVGWAHGDRYSVAQWVGPEKYC